MRSSRREMKHGVHRARQLAIGAAVVAVSALVPTNGQAQACVAGPVNNYINFSGPSSCSIGNVTLSWGPFGGIGGVWNNVNVTPLSGSNARGSFFGLRFTPASTGPLLSVGISAADAQVPNPSYDPNDPSKGPALLPNVQPTFLSSFASWTFTPSVNASTAITRLEVQTLGTRASSNSPSPIPPTYLPSGSPDVNTGCGWSIYDPVTGQNEVATQRCAFFESGSNNFLYVGNQISTLAQTVWNSSGQYQNPDYLTAYCLENGTSVYQLGNDCTSYQDLTGVGFGTPLTFGLSQTANAMQRFAPANEIGLIDPTDPNFANYGASASLDQAEFRVYYQQTNVVPEPGTWALMASGLLGVVVVARRRRTT